MLYRLSDSYLRFFLRFIEPVVDRITASGSSDLRAFYPDNWRSLFSLQVENLVINNRAWILEKLALSEQDILLAGPFQRRATKALAGVQVDYLIQTQKLGLLGTKLILIVVKHFLGNTLLPFQLLARFILY